ncbi:alpha/beta-hydrolase [Stipitochalara longipes BDJ]|nr:alpha/beta-hydrolase [Stipitochalara longipes BDJ]
MNKHASKTLCDNLFRFFKTCRTTNTANTAVMNIQILQKSIPTTDNATISYLEYTSRSTSNRVPKPGLVILHGGLECSHSHAELALALCSTLPIYLPDPRGRGASSDPGSDFSMQTEINDLKALLLATGARYVLGISSGAMIASYAVLELSTNTSGEGRLIEKVATFEPSILLDDFALLEKSRKRFESEIDEGKIAEALITALGMTGMGNWFLSMVPRWLLVPLAKLALKLELKGVGPSREARKQVDAGANEYSMAKLAPTLKFDFRLVKEMKETIERLGKLNEMDVDVLLLSASKSPGYLKRNMQELESLIPRAKYVEFQGLDHLGMGDRNVGGKPEEVAVELRKFLI